MDDEICTYPDCKCPFDMGSDGSCLIGKKRATGNCKMNNKIIIDNAYCDTTDCIHRRGCLKWIGNYSYEEQKKARVWISDVECIDDDYSMIQRFRHSDGSGMLGRNFREEANETA